MRQEAMAIMDNLDILPQKADLITEEGDQFQWSLSDTPHINKDYWSGELSLGLKKRWQYLRSVIWASRTSLYTGSGYLNP